MKLQSDEEFERLVAEGIEAIPERFLRKLENVAIVIADTPTKEQRAIGCIAEGDTLLGLYEGIPITERGDFYGTGVVLPDKITIFKLPIIAEAEGDVLRIKEIVRDTVWHEIAHYFGYDDDEIAQREEAGTNHSA
jgi:predicted Zn-dependent protease with MMP-like domain